MHSVRSKNQFNSTQLMRRAPFSHFRPKSAVQQVVAGQCYVQFRAFDGRRKRHQAPFRSLVDFTFTMQLLSHKIEFVKNLTPRPKSCDKFFNQFLAEIVQL